MIKIFNKQEEIYIPKQPKENNDNQKIKKGYNSIRRLIKDDNNKLQKIYPKINTSTNTYL